MGLAVTLVLAVFWLVLAWRQFQRGDTTLAAVFLVVGVVLTVYRLRRLSAGSGPRTPGTP